MGGWRGVEFKWLGYWVNGGVCAVGVSGCVGGYGLEGVFYQGGASVGAGKTCQPPHSRTAGAAWVWG